MKKMLSCAVLTALCISLSANTVTVFGHKGSMDLKKYQLEVCEFKVDKSTKMSAENAAGCCEALNKSKLVIFGLAFTGWSKLLGNKSIAASFTEFLRRGGVAYFGSQTYESLRYVDTAVVLYCRGIKLAPWQRSNYLNFDKGDNGVNCKMAEEYANFCAPDAKFLNVKRFKNDPKIWKPLVVTAKGTPVAVIQESICEKGTVIYSYDLKIFREANHPMLDALVKKAFGGKTAE